MYSDWFRAWQNFNKKIFNKDFIVFIEQKSCISFSYQNSKLWSENRSFKQDKKIVSYKIICEYKNKGKQKNIIKLMGCCQSKWKRHEQSTDKIERFQNEEQVINDDYTEKSHQISKKITNEKQKSTNKKQENSKSSNVGPGSQKVGFETSFGQDQLSLNKPINRIMLQVIEPSVTHSDFIHQMQIKESVPAEIFSNMNHLDDCFKSSQMESRA